MTADKFSSEPSMDEILASIRQIIEEDSKEKANSPTSQRHDEILDLTDFLPEEASFSMARPSVPLEPNKKKPVLQEEKKETQGFSSSLKDKSQRAAQYDLDDLLVSPSAASETAAALHSLSRHTSEKRPSSLSSFSEDMGSHIIENQLRDILKPLLKEWLDANLPLLVRWIVNEQVEKIMRQKVDTSGKSIKES